MCGIFCTVSCRMNPTTTGWNEADLSRRGPDHTGKAYAPVVHQCRHPGDSCKCYKHVYIAATVLHLRSEHLVPQPVTDPNGNILAWNGEIFGFARPDEMQIDLLTESDTLFLSSGLDSCAGDSGKIFAFLRRRSLLWMRTDCDFFLSSIFPVEVAKQQQVAFDFGEVPFDGLFALQCGRNKISVILFPWVNLWTTSGTDFENSELRHFRQHNETVVHFLSSAENSRLSETDGQKDLCSSLIPDGFKSDTESGANVFEYPLKSEILRLVDTFEDLLRKSIYLRICMANDTCQNCCERCEHTKVAVLFSGGIDSFVMTFMTLEALPSGSSLDLLNVAFMEDGKVVDADNAPDRKTGIEGYNLLASKFPQHTIRFVMINVAGSEVEDIRRSRLWYLLLPQQCVLDSSLGTALWFAARGEGVIKDGTLNNLETYKSPAKIVFSGLGADELLGGYSRHRARFQSGGASAAEAEMLLDLRRIGSRNCGRDDRMISDHGREVRYPFLDEHLNRFILKLPLSSKCDFHLSRGVGDKLLLRLLAKKLGLENIVTLEKRALQFGTRIAKIDKSKNGSDVCPVLQRARMQLNFG
ncbi:asparagine synthetase domain-containing protein 1-like isoform X2 [Paramacrobiotus metropolitanus]|uniref:asparagine synthetase domain-containing protein 1-like isoform X2 n=1 Tax=Paramacrobiotus metropolitanus TaxID=2943436 RepID=UPI00244651E4|nr:asparagine synthetase domain-containing protein 1-like isoform X2 [Paramacrobiotus metropolitanus]